MCCSADLVCLFHFRREEGDLVAEPGCTQTLQELDLSSLDDLLNTAALEESPVTTTFSSSVVETEAQPWRCLSSSPIWALTRFDWGITFYTRVDLKGSFHTYPNVGGPFQSLQEAHGAIDHYLQERRDPTMFTKQPGVSRLDSVVRVTINWPDGTRKLSKSQQNDERRDWKRQLVQAFVDKYNDHHHLLGDLAYELRDVVRYQSLLGGYGRSSRWYNHINFTMNAKGAEDSNCGIDDLFFAEITINRGECIEMVVSCFCMVKPTDNGHCHGCDVKHPNDTAAYYGGEDSSECACSSLFGNMRWTGRDETLEEEEARVRRFYEAEGFDDPDYEERAKEQMTIKPFKPKYPDVATTEELRPVPKTPYVWGGPTYSKGVGC